MACNCCGLVRRDCPFTRGSVPTSRPSSAATSPSIAFLPQYASRATVPSIPSSPVAAQHSPFLSGGVTLSPLIVIDPQHTLCLARQEMACSQDITYPSACQRRDSIISYHLNTSSTVSFESDHSPTLDPTPGTNYNPYYESAQASFDSLPSTFRAHPRQLERRILSKHLSSSTTREHLIRHFSQAGQVVDVDIHHRRGSRHTSAGVSATITFNSPAEAIIAVSTLDGSILNGKVLDVEFYRRRESTRHDRADQGVRVDNTPRHVPTQSWSDHVQLDAGVQEANASRRPSQVGSRDVDRNTTSSGPVIVDGSFRRPR